MMSKDASKKKYENKPKMHMENKAKGPKMPAMKLYKPEQIGPTGYLSGKMC